MNVKDLVLKFISASDAKRFIERLHYSGKSVSYSQIHLGVFYENRCGGVLQFGSSMDKRKLVGLVEGTKWNEFIELNRMALADWLPRNSESRSLSVALRLLKKHYPNLRWVISFADATQCGDGTIYRASGFVLTGITKNTTMLESPSGEIISNLSIKKSPKWQKKTFGRVVLGEEAIRLAKQLGFKKKAGYMLRYIYFLDKSFRSKLTVPEIPFELIGRSGARMYLGQSAG